MPTSQYPREVAVKSRHWSMAQSKVIICPYCGETQAQADRCGACGGLFEPLSRQATHNAMGPWFVRIPRRPFQPGCSYETLRKMIERGQVTKYTILRGPTTKQFWSVARHVPGVAHLLGYCHHCDASVDPGDHGCHSCGVPFGAYLDRNYLGLPEIRPLPWEETAEGEREAPDTFASVPRAAWHEPVESGRISSFATDEELRRETQAGAAAAMGTGAYAGGAASGGASSLATAPARTTPAIRPARQKSKTVAAPAAAGAVAQQAVVSSPRRDERSENVQIRSLQRRLAQQQRTTRVMMIALGVVIVIGAVIGIAVTGGGGGGGGESDGSTSAIGANEGGDKGGDGSRAKPPVAEQDGAGSSDSAAGADSDGMTIDDDSMTPLGEAAAEASPAPPVPADPAVDLRHERLMALVEVGEDRQVPPAEREAALVEAASLLQELRDEGQAKVGEWPVDELAVRIQRAIERLAVEDIFPES